MPRAGPAVLSLMNSAVALLSPPRYQSSRCQIKPGRGKERENKAQKEAGRGRRCVAGVPLVLGFPLFQLFFPFKLFPLQLGFLSEAGHVVALEMVTLSMALGPLLLRREDGCPLFFLSSLQSTFWHPLPLLGLVHAVWPQKTEWWVEKCPFKNPVAVSQLLVHLLGCDLKQG